jgi:CHAD domain-containing protein
MQDVSTASAGFVWRTVRDAAQSQLERILALAGNTHRDSDASIHDIRIGIKRLRAWRRLARPFVVAEQQRLADRELRDAARALGQARDRYVLPQTLTRVAQTVSTEEQRRAFDAVALALTAPVVVDAIDWPLVRNVLVAEQQRWRALAADVGDGTGVDHPWRGLRRTYRRARRLARASLGKAATPAVHHRWRRWVKYLLYQLRLLEGARVDGLQKTGERLNRLADLLGNYHDLLVLHDAVTGLAPGVVSAETLDYVAREIGNEAQRCITSCRKPAQAVFRDSPGRFVARIRLKSERLQEAPSDPGTP